FLPPFLLPLLLPLLSSSPQSPPALECFQCHRVNASGGCESQESFCQTQGSQQCFLRKIYEGDTISYGYQGCSSLWVPMKLFKLILLLSPFCLFTSLFCFLDSTYK
uniref:UPAR/Ly6 domain-containing protein n=1 Tax=Phocoena sinus TaxID=42100 RepID=A0A8C9E3L9_PHOSS